ncbi:MAG: hypothetical protein ABMB14_38810, partial [Myxococcota bacterium]
MRTPMRKMVWIAAFATLAACAKRSPAEYAPAPYDPGSAEGGYDENPSMGGSMANDDYARDESPKTEKMSRSAPAAPPASFEPPPPPPPPPG